MSETKILYVAVPRGHHRAPVVSREEWVRIFAEYPDPLRYHAANLAAHNWDVVMIDGRIMIASPWGNGHWIDKDGSRTDLTSEEFDALYPPSSDPNDRYREAFTHYDGVTRHRRVHLPAIATTCSSTPPPLSPPSMKGEE